MSIVVAFPAALSLSLRCHLRSHKITFNGIRNSQKLRKDAVVLTKQDQMARTNSPVQISTIVLEYDKISKFLIVNLFT